MYIYPVLDRLDLYIFFYFVFFLLGRSTDRLRLGWAVFCIIFFLLRARFMVVLFGSMHGLVFGDIKIFGLGCDEKRGID